MESNKLTLIFPLQTPYPKSTVGDGDEQVVVTVAFGLAAADTAVASTTAPKRAETRTISTYN